MNTNNVSKTIIDERKAKIFAALNEVFVNIEKGQVFKFVDIIRKHGLSWSSGSHSLGAILRDKLKIIETNGKGKPLIYTDEFRNKFADMTVSEIAKIVYRYMENWVVTPRVKKDDPEEIQGSLTEGDTTLLELTELELYGLRQILSETIKYNTTAIGVIAADIRSKLP